METITILLLVGIVVFIGALIGSKGKAPSMLDGTLFILAFASVILISTERWVGGVNWMVNNTKTLFGMAENKFDFKNTLEAMKSETVSKTTAGTVTISGLLLIGAFRFFSSLFALFSGLILGAIVKIWLKHYGMGIEGIV